MKKEIFINEKRPHESGIKHVSGRAYYTDDIPEPLETLYGAIGWSKKAHAIIKKINLDEVVKSAGVIAVVTGKDIVGCCICFTKIIFYQYIFKIIGIINMQQRSFINCF